MDLNLIRSIVTVLAFGAFVLIVVRVWRSANRDRYAEAAALPFADEVGPGPTPSRPGEKSTAIPGKTGSHAGPKRVDPGFRRDDHGSNVT